MSVTYSIENLQTLGFVFAGLFLILGAFDGIYFHLIKYKLHLYPESQFEHRIHSVRGILLGLIGAIVFATKTHASPFNNTPLVAAMILITIDLVLEVIDIYVEKISRAAMGGVSSTEMVLHVFASSFRMAAIVLLMIVATDRGFSPVVNVAGQTVSYIALVIGAAGIFLQNSVVPSRQARL